MNLHLAPGMPTYQSDAWHTWSTLDLVFSSPELTDYIDICDAMLTERLPGTDHLPIHTIINLPLKVLDPAPKRNFRDVYWPDFIKSVEEAL